MLNYKPKRNVDSKDVHVSKPYKKKRRNPKSEKLRDVELETGKPVPNDPNWYFSDTTLAEQVSRISFNQFIGEPFDLGGGRISAQVNIPNIAVAYLNPSAGFTQQNFPQRSGLNMAGFKLYTELSARNSKTTSYAPQDVTMLILALGSMLTMESFIRRLFGITTAYNVRNRMYAKGVAETMKLNFDDFIANRADYLAEFNYVLNTVNKIPFPDNIPYFKKCRTLFDNIYVDSGNSMAQSILTVPDSVWIFDEAYSEHGSGLRTTSVVTKTAGLNSFSYYLDIFESQINALLNSTTLNYVYSDVLAYVGKNPGVALLHLSTLPSDYAVLPIYSETFMLQWRNATICGNPSATPSQTAGNFTSSNDVVSDANLNCVRYSPEFQADYPWMALDAIIDFPTDHPDTASIIESTRLTVRADAVLAPEEAGGGYYTTEVALPDFYITSVYVYANNSRNALWYISQPIYYAVFASHFTHFPRAYVFSETSKQFLHVSGDTEYFTTVTKQYLMRLNDICYQGLFELR